MSAWTPTSLAAVIDHTCLSPTATREQLTALCEEARTYGFCTVCVGPRWIDLACDLLLRSPVNVCSVIGFPLGFESTRIKTRQCKEAILDGADEIDMVADLAAVIDGDANYLRDQFRSVLKICRVHRPAVTLKVIIESAALTHEQKRLVCHCADHVGVDFIKTSTGLHPSGGATVEDIRLIKSEAPNCQVKAAGGIRTLEQALAMLDAGATRIGTSASVAIVQSFCTGAQP